MADETLRNWFMAFWGAFWKFSLLCQPLICPGLIQRKQKPSFYHIPCIKTLWWVFKADDRCHDRGGTVRLLRKLWFYILRKRSRTWESIQERRVSGWFLEGNPERTDKLAFLEGKFLNYIFLVSYIPLVPAINFSVLSKLQPEAKNFSKCLNPILPPHCKDLIEAQSRR